MSDSKVFCPNSFKRNPNHYQKIPEHEWKSPFNTPGMREMAFWEENWNRRSVDFIKSQKRNIFNGTIYTRFYDGSYHYQNKECHEGKVISTYFRARCKNHPFMEMRAFYSVGRIGSPWHKNYIIWYGREYADKERKDDGHDYYRGINKFGQHFEKTIDKDGDPVFDDAVILG